MVKRFFDNSSLAEKIHVASGTMLDASHIHKFGAVPSMSVSTAGTIWDIDDTIYPWATFNTASVINIPAVNAADTGHQVTIFGLDANYEDQSETLTISNVGTTTGTKLFKRVFRAYYTNGAITNTGNIDIRVSTTIVARITVGKAQTLMALYTVPTGYTGYLMKGITSIEYGGDATIDMFVRYFGQSAFRIGHTGEVAGTGMPYMYEFSIPIPIPEKSDIDIRATCRSNNSRVTAAFDLLLVRN
jgi:hypothetical protein